MMKKSYLAPQTETVNVKFESHLLDISSTQPYSITGGGDDEGDGESE